MENIIKYMTNKEWSYNEKDNRNKLLLKSMKENDGKTDFVTQMGYMNLYHMMIEEMLKDIITRSISYVKAEIWPSKFNIECTEDKSDMLQLIDCFERNAVVYNSYDDVLRKLHQYNNTRCELQSALFGVADISSFESSIENFLHLSHELVLSLRDYIYNVECELEELFDRADFTELDDE